MTFVDLNGVWINVDQIVRIDRHPLQREGWTNAPMPPEVTRVITFSTGDMRGISDEEFEQIMNISKAKRDG